MATVLNKGVLDTFDLPANRSVVMTQSPSTTYRRIVVGTDGTASATASVRHAAALARESGGVLHIVGAYVTGEDRVPICSILDRVAGQVADPEFEIELYAVEAEPAQALSWVANRKDADLIVVGHQAAGGRLPCPVLTVDTKDHRRARRGAVAGRAAQAA
jgi:nucleotide-binding universal stress UspA family protein